jgi:ubiquinol-cytochrome c reductase cytochrome c subunit
LRRRRILAWLGPAGGVGLAAAALLAVVPRPVAAQATAPGSLVERGRDLFLVSCASCHGADGRGTRDAPTLEGVGAAAADFQLSTGRMPLAAPGAQAVRKPPAFRGEDREALVAYVASLGPGPPIPSVNPAAGDLPRGGQLFRLNCAACHGFAGRGGALSYGRHAPPLIHATSLQVAEAIRTGPGQMPVFGPATLDEQEVDSIVRYVSYLHHPDDRGGLGLGHLGPIPEGLVAGIFGLGAVALVTRWIERRA